MRTSPRYSNAPGLFYYHLETPMLHPTDRELHSFYGNAPDTFEIACAIERHTRAIDKDDLAEVCHEYEADILQAIRGKNAAALMAIFTDEINKTVARRASFSLYGDVSVIPVSEATQ